MPLVKQHRRLVEIAHGGDVDPRLRICDHEARAAEAQLGHHQCRGRRSLAVFAVKILAGLCRREHRPVPDELNFLRP